MTIYKDLLEAIIDGNLEQITNLLSNNYNDLRHENPGRDWDLDRAVNKHCAISRAIQEGDYEYATAIATGYEDGLH